MSTPVKVSGCGTVVNMDFGSGAVVMGLCDSVTPWNQSKTIVDTPTLDCAASSEVGREEQSLLTFTQYWDPQDADQAQVVTNFEDSIDDASLKDVTVQCVTQSYATGGTGASAMTVTLEATCQVATIEPAEITPEGHWKRTVTVVRKSDITKTVA